MKKAIDNLPYQVFILLMCVLSLGVLVFDTFIVNDHKVKKLLIWSDFALCVIFLLDYVYLVVTAKNKTRYILTWGLLDLSSCIPAVGWFRAVRILRFVRMLKAIVIIGKLLQGFRGQKGATALFTTLCLMICGVLFGSIMILQCESQSGNISNASDALWWTFCTMLKGGCENYDPVTGEGRCVAVVLSILGLGINGSVIAWVATLLLSDEEKEER